MSDHFKKKILHRAKYRGIKELDIIFDRFVKKYSTKLLDDEFYELDRILSLPDQLLLDIILGKEIIPANLQCKTLKNLILISYEWS
jgi:succinate dehydrogenase flavin-adding protein (antitoxin of CptAB toxin-antitoxin module)